jgi:hypothetical protein
MNMLEALKQAAENPERIFARIKTTRRIAVIGFPPRRGRYPYYYWWVTQYFEDPCEPWLSRDENAIMDKDWLNAEWETMTLEQVKEYHSHADPTKFAPPPAEGKCETCGGSGQDRRTTSFPDLETFRGKCPTCNGSGVKQ